MFRTLKVFLVGVTIFSSISAERCFSMDLKGACELVSGGATLVCVLREVADFSSEKILSKEAPVPCIQGDYWFRKNMSPLYKYALLDTALWDSWKVKVSEFINSRTPAIKYPVKFAKKYGIFRPSQPKF